jgi:hypothetical protein
MENCFLNKHKFLLSESEKKAQKYFEYSNKDACHKCNSSKNVTKVIHSTLSKTLKNIALYSKDIKLGGKSCPKNSNKYCRKCEVYF